MIIGTPAALAIGFAAAAATRGDARLPPPPPPPVTSTRAPHLFSSYLARILAPSDWSERAIPPDASRLGLRFPIAIAPSQSSSDAIVLAGAALRKYTPSLLTRALARASGRRRGMRLRLGSIQGIRYTKVSLPGRSTPAVVYALPTDRRVLFVLCLPSQPAASAFLTECERIASTARPVNGYPVSLLSSVAYANRLAAMFENLRGRLGRVHAQLMRAKTRGTQAKAAFASAAEYTTAAGALDRLAPRPQVRSLHRTLAVDLRAARAAYRALARAATRGDEVAWRSARQRVSLVERRTARDATTLRAALILPLKRT